MQRNKFAPRPASSYLGGRDHHRNPCPGLGPDRENAAGALCRPGAALACRHEPRRNSPEALAASSGVPEKQRKMRIQQLWHWIYFRGAQSLRRHDQRLQGFRAELAKKFTVARPEVVAEQVSVDGTRKWLLRLPGEHAGERPHEVECVYIPDTGRGTLCISSQVGCTLTCSFCHTGTQRLVRNLTAGEIIGQLRGRARPHRRLAGRHAAERRPGAAGWRALHHQHRDDGDG